MSESSQLVADIQLQLSRGPTRLLRINSGKAWAGKIIEQSATRLVLLHYHAVQLAPAGTADLFGWTTEEGRAIATAIEAKTGTGRATKEQRDFLELLVKMGGKAGVARSVEDARRIVNGELT